MNTKRRKVDCKESYTVKKFVNRFTCPHYDVHQMSCFSDPQYILELSEVRSILSCPVFNYILNS